MPNVKVQLSNQLQSPNVVTERFSPIKINPEWVENFEL
jgi:hypothetical protein